MVLRKKEQPFQPAKNTFAHVEIFKELSIQSDVVKTAWDHFG